MAVISPKNSRSWLWLAGTCAGLLVGALLLQLYLSPKGDNKGQASIQLAAKIPASLPGWKMKELPLGQNELVTAKTTEILRYDEYVYREFFNGRQSFAIYSAYWGPGKMPTRLVEIHTPDRCWIENGWECHEQKYGVGVSPLVASDLPPAQWRLFTPPGSQQKVYVYFWLMVDGKPYDFGRMMNKVPNPIEWWKDVIEEAAGGSKEHLFVRITSDRPFEELSSDAGWRHLLESLSAVGLKAD